MATHGQWLGGWPGDWFGAGESDGHAIVCTGIVSAEAFGQPRISTPQTTGGTVYFRPRPLAAPHRIAAVGIRTSEAVGAPIVVFVGRGERARRRAAAVIDELLMA